MLSASSGSKQGQTPVMRFTSELCLWQGFFFCDNKKPTLGSVECHEMEGRVDIPEEANPRGSLEGDLSANFFDGLLKGFGFVLGHAFLDGLGCSLDHGLGITKTQASGLTHSLEDFDLG